MTNNVDQQVREVITKLRAAATPAQHARLTKRGVEPQFALGCSKSAVQAQAKALLRSAPADSLHALGTALWATQVHEARQLALRILPVAQMTGPVIERFAGDTDSWGLADDLARYVLCRMPVRVRDRTTARLVTEEALYRRRTGFAGIACTMIHAHDSVSATRVDTFCRAIVAGGADERRHVKKAVSWALREIGKASAELLDIALETAAELADGDRHQAWVARDALRELTQLTAVDARRRLLKQSSKTAQGERA